MNLTRIHTKYNYIIGIDCGVQTGFCVYGVKEKAIMEIDTRKIHEVMWVVAKWKEYHGKNILVRVEDARKRKWFGSSDREKLQGAGSVKRDAKIWEDFLFAIEVDFEMVEPKNNKTKLDRKKFKMFTGYDGVTTEHARDAAMLVYGF
jgi:hypothetical protein